MVVMKRLGWVLAIVVLTSGCVSLREIVGYAAASDPSVTLKSAEPRWLLIKNSRFGDVASEPEYVWVEEDKVPLTLTKLIRGERAIIAPPEIVSQYGPPPGGGRISPRQRLPYQVGDDRERAAPVKAAKPAKGAPGNGPVSAVVGDTPKRGFVVWADTTRIVVDLTAKDGLRPGSVVSLRRDKIPIVHLVTGELLGELDEEVATARVTETRDRFSVAEIQATAPGAHVQVKDRVVLK